MSIIGHIWENKRQDIAIPVYVKGERFPIHWKNTTFGVTRAELMIGDAHTTILECDDDTYVVYVIKKGEGEVWFDSNLDMDGVEASLIEIERLYMK